MRTRTLDSPTILSPTEHRHASLNRLALALHMPIGAIFAAREGYLRTGTIGIVVHDCDDTVPPGERLEVTIRIYGTALSEVVERSARLERCTAAEVASTARALAGLLAPPVIATIPGNLGDVDVCVRHEPWGAEVDIRTSHTSGRWSPISMLGGAFVVRDR
jgi:hypothetical protein